MNILVQVYIMDEWCDDVNMASISLDDAAIKHIRQLSKKAKRTRISEWDSTPELGNFIDSDGCPCPEDEFFAEIPYLSQTPEEIPKVFKVNEDFRTDVCELHVDGEDFWYSGHIKHTDTVWETKMIPVSFLPQTEPKIKPAKPKADLNLSLEDRVTILEKIAAGVNSGLNDREIAEVSLKGVSKAHLVACIREKRL